ncbi:hypothetical protein HU200_037095 [Digitaria exilis]|uniref:Uncharacterized protein n=1 Tax=Digitaria exilis TaxID=1010633 RepID=A0A835BFH3_9POAL|nr:hypothetical protein HU200_037095 [Digitaria exilis]
MNPRRQHYSLKEDLSSVRTFILLTFWLSSPIWFWLLRALPPKFSVELVGSKGFLDTPPEQSDAPFSTAFNVTLHAANRRLHDVCYRHGEAAVRYSGFTVAWGRTRAFCVGKKEARDVPVVAWADGLAMPGSIRERLAANLRAGAVELEVDVREAVQGRRWIGQTNVAVVQGEGRWSEKAAGYDDAVHRVRVAELGIRHCTCLDGVVVVVFSNLSDFS